VRDAVQQALYNDVRSGLRELGYNDADAKWGAAVVDEMPDATLEECMRAALRRLSRPLLMRGERLARSTA
jgi:Holliday junction resolvasome RuvABC DNA-binding subunit